MRPAMDGRRARVRSTSLRMDRRRALTVPTARRPPAPTGRRPGAVRAAGYRSRDAAARGALIDLYA